jgi:hypothetical protein
MKTFGMREVGVTESPIASGVYLSDGTVQLALLNYKTDAAAGQERAEHCRSTRNRSATRRNIASPTASSSTSPTTAGSEPSHRQALGQLPETNWLVK